MFKKLLAATVAAGLGAIALPSLPASAAVTAPTAQLTVGQQVFPGNGTANQGQNFTVAVKNGEAAALPGMGKNINGVRITFPAGAGIVLNGTSTGVAPGGWTATAKNLGGTNFIEYRGGSIAPQATTAFTFPANVLAPLDSDLRGDFVVQVSDDNFTSSATTAKPSALGALTTAVEVLEIVNGTVKPTALDNCVGGGVTDRTGTAGQTINYTYDVKNYSRSDLLVTPSLVSSDSNDVPQPAQAVTITKGAVAQAVNVKLALGSVLTGLSRTTQVTAKAVAAKADAGTVTDNFRVQAPVKLDASGLQPLRTKSTDGVSSDTSRTFTLQLAKTGEQALTLQSSTLSFPTGNSADAQAPIAYGANGSSKSLSYSFAKIDGADGQVATSLKNVGKDDNCAVYDATLAAGLITIDNKVPTLTITATLPVDQDQDQQVASSNSDVIAVAGTITSQGDLDAGTLRVVLKDDKAIERVVTVTQTSNADGTVVDFKGSVNVGQWAAGVTKFNAIASVKDVATNLGSVTGVDVPVDVTLPVLQDNGFVKDTSTIELTFADISGIRGGCDARSYLIDGVPGTVATVEGPGGSACDPRALSNFNAIRVLKLSRPLSDPTVTPRVTYQLLDRQLAGVRPAKDGAGNDVITTTIDTINKVVPAPPQLVNVERKDSGSTSGAFENAYLDADEKAYYTNQAGDKDNRVTVAGARNGYQLRIVGTCKNADGTTYTCTNTSPTLSGGTLVNPTFQATIDIPVTKLDGLVKYDLFFLTSQAISVGTPITVVLDRVRPAIATSALQTPTSVKTTFNDKVIAGSDFVDNWFVAYEVDGENGAKAIQRKAVEAISAADTTSRTFSVDIPLGAPFKGTDYFVLSGTRYEDRGGNTFADTLADQTAG